NVAGAVDIPFVFGGDGASLLIPPTLLEETTRSLRSIQTLAKDEFDLSLRVGIVPVGVATQAGHPVDIAKLEISENYSQAVFMGGGLTYATNLVKDPATAHLYRLNLMEASSPANFLGLECRWQDIPSRYGETVSLLVLATQNEQYRDVIEQIQLIYGAGDRHNPITRDRLSLSFSPNKLIKETKLRASASHWFSKLNYLVKIELENLLGWMFMTFNLNIGGTDWSKYQDVVVAATDYRKFDDMLRMVIAGDALQREKLTDYLEKKYRSGNLVYGLHVSDRALLTCLVFDRNGRQVHFVDGADGGYALAAKEMKARM
ncbi:MAG: DUF3095 domain-containing protein, partial [Phormidesmis sp. CAN_BIN44]|nr:DUF3095 domain-containing protein [Phormidesmis sp. CAN_BIN44]